ncbi:polysaccharide deacetylase family protein [bacterium]|nr:polysaccharide deacetylase family protein [bacterium]
MKLFFNYSIDCETPLNTPYTGGTERQPFFGGPKSWETAEASVRGFARQMNELGLARGTTLFVYPDVARHQRALYREMAAAGVEIALHLNGLRYSRLTGDRAKWLGSMSRDEQREALRMAKADLEESVGRPGLGYRACYGSSNDDTFPICEELGFRWTSQPSSRYRPEVFSNWSGSWPYPHHAHRRSKLIPGDLKLYEMPITCGRRVLYQGNPDQPLDLRAETPPSILGDQRERLREVVAEALVEMDRRDAPIRMIVGGSHNTNPFGEMTTFQAQNLDWLVRHLRELAAQHGCELVPAPFEAVRQEAERVGAY